MGYAYPIVADPCWQVWSGSCPTKMMTSARNIGRPIAVYGTVVGTITSLVYPPAAPVVGTTVTAATIPGTLGGGIACVVICDPPLMVIRRIKTAKRRCELALTILWVELLVLPDKLNAGSLIIPSTAPWANFVRVAKFLCLGMGVAISEVFLVTFCFAAITGISCSIAIAGGFLLCAIGVFLVALLQRKREMRDRSGFRHWLGGCRRAVCRRGLSSSWSSRDDGCWIAGIVAIFTIVIGYTGCAEILALIKEWTKRCRLASPTPIILALTRGRGSRLGQLVDAGHAALHQRSRP